MADSLFLHFQLILKYIAIFFYFYFAGRSFLEIVNKIIFKNLRIPKKILFTKSSLLFPLIGVAYVGNLLIILNYLFPLKIFIINIFLLLALTGNLLEINLKIKDKITFNNFFNLIVISSILIVSSYDTSWHVDAGYYHLNHQNWLLESNMILGQVNIFWAFGMSSIYEYISAVLWFDRSFILIHFLTIIFIHTFYMILIEYLREKKVNELYFASIFILIFSLLDNFGVEGGRNGFIYIQGVTKQDIPVAIIFVLVSLWCFLIIKNKKSTDFDLMILFLLSFFIVQIKLSSVVIVYLLFIVVAVLYKPMFKEKPSQLKIFIPTAFFFCFWLLKGYLTTGCFLFPLSSTCINNFDWYITNSTESFESVTTTASYSLIDYFYQSKSVSDWWTNFYSYKINRTVFLNFVFSFLLIYLFKRLFFKVKRLPLFLNFSIFSFVLLNIIYLSLYGPTPRYAVGTILMIIGALGLNVSKMKVNINTNLFVILYFISIFFLVRASSYQAFLDNPQTVLFDPVELAKYEPFIGDWVKPDVGDACWINLKCTMERENIYFDEGTFFKIAYKDL